MPKQYMSYESKRNTFHALLAELYYQIQNEKISFTKVALNASIVKLLGTPYWESWYGYNLDLIMKILRERLVTPDCELMLDDF